MGRYTKKKVPQIRTRHLAIIVLILEIILILNLIYIWVDNKIAIEGVDLTILLTKTAQIENENTIIHAEILQKESFSYIYQQAIHMGFVPYSANTIIYLQ